MGEWLLSRRDRLIVAWHEVPGTAPSQKSRPVGYGMIRAGERTNSSDWMIGVTKLRNTKLKQFVLYDFYLAFLKKHGTPFDGKYLWDELRPIIPCPTGRLFRGGRFPGTSCQATIGVVPTGRCPFVEAKSPDATFCKCPNCRAPSGRMTAAKESGRVTQLANFRPAKASSFRMVFQIRRGTLGCPIFFRSACWSGASGRSRPGRRCKLAFHRRRQFPGQ